MGQVPGQGIRGRSCGMDIQTVLILSLTADLALGCFSTYRPHKTHGRGTGVVPVLCGRSGRLGEVYEWAGGIRT